MKNDSDSDSSAAKRGKKAKAAKKPAPAPDTAAADEGEPSVSLQQRLQVLLAACLPQVHAPQEPPWRMLPWLLLLAFVLRAIVSLNGDFVLHPDEIMQYLEPAHALVFGSGTLYWEFYYGLRSWLVPGFVAGVLFLCDMVGLGEPTYYVPAVKLVLCALSLLLPWSLYVLGRRLFDEDTGRIALLLGVFWYELVGFAHKPMSEFIATPLFFALLVFVLRPQRLTPVQAALAGAFAVGVVAVRFQYAPLVGLLWLVPFVQGDLRSRLLLAAASAAAVLAVGLFDMLTWGNFLQSYWFNFKANLVLNQGRGWESSPWIYLGWVSVASGGLILVALYRALQHFRQHMFLLLLCLALVLPHLLSAHREYRFIFALIPIWLLVFANLAAAGWHVEVQRSLSGLLLQWRKPIALGCAMLVSAAGIANALPAQRWVYTAFSFETGYVNFLHGQDEMFSIYRRLAADDSVRGIRDVTRPYFNTGGYYYLHRKVPLYDSHSFHPPVEQLDDYVSHVIGFPMMKAQELVRGQDNRLYITVEGGIRLPLPVFISDAATKKLVFWSASGQPKFINQFALLHESGNFTIWQAKEDKPVRTWRRFVIAPGNADMLQFLEQARLDDIAEPVPNNGIEFADNADGK